MVDTARSLKEAGAYLIGRIRRAEYGDQVEIARILPRPEFKTPLAREKLSQLWADRDAIIGSHPKGKIRIRGVLTGKAGKRLWKISVPSAEKSLSPHLLPQRIHLSMHQDRPRLWFFALSAQITTRPLTRTPIRVTLGWRRQNLGAVQETSQNKRREK